MIRSRRHPAATQATSRLAAYTDGVFAISATLLVLDLTAHSLDGVTSDQELWAALGDMWLQFMNFGVSFLLLSLLWMIHVRQFESVARVDAAMTWLNNGRLLFIVLVPFATATATDHPDLLAGRLLMPVTFFMSVLFSWLQWTWAVRNREVMLPDMPEADAREGRADGLSAVIIGAAVVAVSPWLGTAGFALFVLDQPLTRLLRGRMRGN